MVKGCDKLNNKLKQLLERKLKELNRNNSHPELAKKIRELLKMEKNNKN